MDYAVIGLKSEGFLEDVSHQLFVIVESLNQGLDSHVQKTFFDLFLMVESSLKEDLQLGGNPALSEWRLDQLNDWISSYILDLEFPRKPRFPAFTLDPHHGFGVPPLACKRVFVDGQGRSFKATINPVDVEL